MISKVKIEHIGEFNLTINKKGIIESFSGKHYGDFNTKLINTHYVQSFQLYPELKKAVNKALYAQKVKCEIDLGKESLTIDCYPIRVEGHFIGTILVASDSTEQRKEKKNLESRLNYFENYNKDLERFAYAASHDLHEPLRAVNSFIGLLELEYAETLDEDAKAYLKYALNGTQRMQKLIDDLLEYNRLGEHNLKIRPIVTERIIELQTYKLSELIKEKEATIEMLDYPTNIVGNSKQIGLVFYHLIKNALTFTDKTPNIKISGEEKENEWIFAVTDNGKGIDPKNHESIFEVFYKLNNPNNLSTGIGLALCLKVCRRHGGNVWLKSEKGQGATFYFSISKEILNLK